MNQNTYLLILCLFLGAIGQGQENTYRTYNELMAQARSFSNAKEYASSQRYYDSAFALIDWVTYDYLSAALMASKTSNYTLVNSYLTTGIIKGWEPDDIQIDELVPYYASPEYHQLLQQYDSLHLVYWNSIDTHYVQQLDSLFTLQKEFRRSVEDKNFTTKEELFAAFLERVQRHGFPTYEKVGAYYIHSYFFLLEQIDTYPSQSYWSELFPYIDEGIETGKITPIFYIRLEEKQNP